MLKIHCCPVPSQRNVVSGVDETTSSLIVALAGSAPAAKVPKSATTPAVPTATPLASHTRNFAGTVLPFLNTLLPSGLIGWRMLCVLAPIQTPPLTYCTFTGRVAGCLLP